MAKFYRNDKSIGYLIIGFMELIKYSQNGFPICDECSKDLIGYDDIILVPILNQAYCNSCGKKVLATIVDYPEDRQYRERKEQFWLDYFKIEEEGAKAMNIIKVKFLKDGQPSGRAYTYYSDKPVAIDDKVQINLQSIGIVTEIDVPKEEIEDYRNLVKFIHGKYEESIAKVFDPIKANEAQTKYCADNNCPHFAPEGKCWKCNNNIYESLDRGNGYSTGIDVERAGTELITGCPHCNRTYCD